MHRIAESPFPLCVGIMQIERVAVVGNTLMNAKKSMMNLYCRTGQQLNGKLSCWTAVIRPAKSDPCPLSNCIRSLNASPLLRPSVGGHDSHNSIKTKEHATYKSFWSLPHSSRHHIWPRRTVCKNSTKFKNSYKFQQ